MQFDYMNDIHLDFWVPFNTNQIKFEKKTREFANSLLPDSPSNTLILGGDIGHFNKQNYWFIEELSHRYTTILLVFGNHDYYLISTNQSNKYKRNSFNRVNEMKELIRVLDNVQCLEGNIIDIEGISIGGTGMWYDFQFGQQHLNQTYEEVRHTWRTNSNDSKLIKHVDTIIQYQTELEKMKKIIGNCDVVVSHVGPDWSFSPYESNQQLHNSYYFFDGAEVLSQYSNRIWTFGHIHTELDETKDGWRFISYGLGYPDEGNPKRFKQIRL